MIGDVTVEENASVWYGVVLRGDFGPIVVRAGANVQDGTVVHSPKGIVTEIGPGATIGHACVVHGATIGEEALVGNHATVLDGAAVGARNVVAAGSVVTGEIPAEVLAMGTPRGPRARSPAPRRRPGCRATRRSTVTWRSGTGPGSWRCSSGVRWRREDPRSLGVNRASTLSSARRPDGTSQCLLTLPSACTPLEAPTTIGKCAENIIPWEFAGASPSTPPGSVPA